MIIIVCRKELIFVCLVVCVIVATQMKGAPVDVDSDAVDDFMLSMEERQAAGADDSSNDDGDENRAAQEGDEPEFNYDDLSDGDFEDADDGPSAGAVTYYYYYYYSGG